MNDFASLNKTQKKIATEIYLLGTSYWAIIGADELTEELREMSLEKLNKRFEKYKRKILSKCYIEVNLCNIAYEENAVELALLYTKR